MTAYRVLSILDEDTVPVSGGTLQWVPLRRRLGIRAFGTNAFRAERAGDRVVEDHEESPGQEELYVVLAGSARFVVGDDEVVVGHGDAVFLPQPDVRRGATALEDGTTVLAVGGWPDRPYHPLPWEPIYLAQDAMLRGDWSVAAGILEREGAEHLDTGIVRFRLACCRAQAGDHDRAIEDLRQAIELSPAMGDRAAAENLLAPLRDRDDWPITR
ncbi:MAG TPA: tetratricopeptide repeat protein [Solirubrobacteraceae bacterium]|nr:tetratricopeptide repeat protein [Solirubrobacteraceae bacterium]